MARPNTACCDTSSRRSREAKGEVLHASAKSTLTSSGVRERRNSEFHAFNRFTCRTAGAERNHRVPNLQGKVGAEAILRLSPSARDFCVDVRAWRPPLRLQNAMEGMIALALLYTGEPKRAGAL